MELNKIYNENCLDTMARMPDGFVDLVVTSPPYFVGKDYEKHLTYEDWADLLKSVISQSFRIIKPGGFMAINIADTLCFRDAKMPKIQFDVAHRRKPPTKADVEDVLTKNPNLKKSDISAHFECSEQTIDRRLNGNNARGGKYNTQTKVKIVGGLIEMWAENAGFFVYDRRIWVKDPAWANSKWVNQSFRAVDEFEYVYFLWKPGVTKFDKTRISEKDWVEWGSRAVWFFPSVRQNKDHPAKFPIEMPFRIIRLLSGVGDLVFDPFMGSGTTAKAAHLQNRKWIGSEISADYVALAEKEIEPYVLQGSLFTSYNGA